MLWNTSSRREATEIWNVFAGDLLRLQKFRNEPNPVWRTRLTSLASLTFEQGRRESRYPCVSIRVRFADFAFVHGWGAATCLHVMADLTSDEVTCYLRCRSIRVELCSWAPLRHERSGQ